MSRLPLFKVAMSPRATAGLYLVLHMATTAAADGTRFDLATRDPSAEPGEILTTPLPCTATNWPIVTQALDFRWVDTR